MQGFVVLLWVTWIVSYFAYLSSNDVAELARLECDSTRFTCAIAQGITNWLVIMTQLR